MSTLASSSGMAETSGLPMWSMSIFYIFFALLYFMPTLYLYRFATKMQLALNREDQFILSSSFEKLKSCFKFMGIMTAIILGFYALILFGAIVAGAFAS